MTWTTSVITTTLTGQNGTTHTTTTQTTTSSYVWSGVNSSDPAPFRCQVAEDFKVDVGQFSLVGPAEHVGGVTCVSGQACRLWGITGYGLLERDVYSILDTCGTSDSIERSPQEGASYKVTSRGAQVAWGSAGITSAGGNYRLCWCAGEQVVNNTEPWYIAAPEKRNCAVPEEFRVDVSEFLLLGPSPLYQHRTCISGRTCKFEGLLGETQGRVTIVDTCGTHAGPFQAVIKYPPQIVSYQDLLKRGIATVSSNETGTVFFGNDEVNVAGGIYSMCWCASVSSCYTTKEFLVNFGKLTILGPTP